MKLLQLKYFQTVCNYSSVTKAANILNVSQPSISASIKGLEDEFGIDLFRRVKQQLILTSEGAFLLKYANDILDMTGTLEQKMQDLGRHQRNLRIAVPPISGTFAFNDLYFAYRSVYPNEGLEIIESGSTSNLLAVAEETVDLALATTGTIKNDQLNVLPLKTIHIVLCVAASHPLASEPEISFGMLRDEPLILFRKGSKHNELIQQRFAAAGIEPKVLLYSSQIHTIRRFISNGCGAAFVFDGVTELFEDSKTIPIPDLPGQTVDLVWKKEDYLNNKERYLFREVGQFVSFARAYISHDHNATAGQPAL